LFQPEDLSYLFGMNVFVTGGAGYIGSVCVEELINAGHDVTVYDNLSEGHRSAVDNRAAFILARLSDEESITQALKDSKAEAVIHFAANALVPESMVNPGKYFRNNVANGVHLLNATVAAGIRKFVFSSTCATYGPPDRVPMTEDLPQRPVNPYGESKLIFERMLNWAGIRRLSLLQRGGRHRAIRRRPPARDAPHPQCAQGATWAGGSLRSLRLRLSNA
jgi:UDP-glucose 4-epimerase